MNDRAVYISLSIQRSIKLRTLLHLTHLLRFLRSALRGSILPCCCLATCAVSAQQYELRGVVTDGSSGETLIGASVVLKGTTTGATTDIDGRFEITALPPGTYTVEAWHQAFALDMPDEEADRPWYVHRPPIVLTREITVEPGKDIDIDFTFPVD